MARKDEKTIKMTADTADVQKAFARVEDAYADVAKAADSYADAVKKSSQAVTKDEQKAAAEHEKATKKILDSAKKRATALKTTATAMQEQQKAVTSLSGATEKHSKVQDSATKVAATATAATLALGMAVLGAAKKFAELTKKVAENDSVSAKTRETAQSMVGSIDNISTSSATAAVEVANLVSALLGLDGADEALDNLDRNIGKITLGFRTLAIMAREGIGLEAAVEALIAEDKLAAEMEASAKRVEGYHKQVLDQQEALEKSTNERVAKNYAERVKVMEDADKERERQRAARAAEAKRKREQDAALTAQDEKDAAFNDAEVEIANKKAEEDAYALQIQQQANQLIDETNTRLQQEMELRQELAKLKANPEEMEALERQQQLERDLFAIRASGMSDEAKARERQITLVRFQGDISKEMTKEEEETAEKRKEALKQTGIAMTSLGAAALEQAGMANAAIALEAGQKVAYSTAEAIAAFASLNPISGAGFLAAAAQYAIVAGGSISSNMSAAKGGGSKSPASMAPASRSNAVTPSQGRDARDTSITVNNNTLSYIAPEDTRRIAEGEVREVRSQVGGSRARRR